MITQPTKTRPFIHALSALALGLVVCASFGAAQAQEKKPDRPGEGEGKVVKKPAEDGGDFKKPDGKDGEGVKKPIFKDGDGVKKPEGEFVKKPGIKDGGDFKKPDGKDGEDVKKPAFKDGDGVKKPEGEPVKKGVKNGADFTKTALKDAGNAKTPSIGNFPFWPSAKGGGTGGQYVPGLNAVLELTGGQIHQIHDAQEATTGSEEIRALGSKGKTGTPAEQEAARAAWDKARADLNSRVAKVLTEEQSARIAKIAGAHAEAAAAVREEFQDRFGAAKGDKEAARKLDAEFRARLEAVFLTRIDAFLTPAQHAAREQAADAEKAAGANASKVKK